MNILVHIISPSHRHYQKIFSLSSFFPFKWNLKGLKSFYCMQQILQPQIYNSKNTAKKKKKYLLVRNFKNVIFSFIRC